METTTFAADNKSRPCHAKESLLDHRNLYWTEWRRNKKTSLSGSWEKAVENLLEHQADRQNMFVIDETGRNGKKKKNLNGAILESQARSISQQHDCARRCQLRIHPPHVFMGRLRSDLRKSKESALRHDGSHEEWLDIFCQISQRHHVGSRRLTHRSLHQQASGPKRTDV